MVDVVVEHDYTALETDELSINKGDVIREVVKMKGGWWEGTLNGKRGMFPDNFVRDYDKDMSFTYKRKEVHTASGVRQCRVLFSYKADHLDELELNVGDIINIVSEEEEGWWRGVLNGREGVFPSNFVEEIKQIPGSREDLSCLNDVDKTPTLPPKPAKQLCQVKYSYKAQNDDELSLKEGDIINLVSKDGLDPGWWKGELNGHTGVFPDNFVAILDNPERISVKSENVVLKSSTISQRKSLEENTETKSTARVIPAVSNKKPAVPIKKSPSGGNSQGGILAGLRKKITDGTGSANSKNVLHTKVTESKVTEVMKAESIFAVSESKTGIVLDSVDGNLSTKSQPQLLKVSEIKEEFKEEGLLENAFDRVERSSMLSDVRATRAKGPGRRPPSVIFKDGEPGVINGNTDHIPMDIHPEIVPTSRPTSVNDQGELTELKPRVREWEKHKAPWLEEMKLNQAKRTSSPSPNSEPSKLKLTPTDKSLSPDSDEVKSPFEKLKNIPDLAPVSKSVIIEKVPVALRNKTPQVIGKSPVTNSNDQVKHDPSKHSIISNSFGNENNRQSTTSACQSPEIKGTSDIVQDNICVVHFMELLQRIERIEMSLEAQQHIYTASIDDLKNRLLRLENQINPH